MMNNLLTSANATARGRSWSFNTVAKVLHAIDTTLDLDLACMILRKRKDSSEILTQYVKKVLQIKISKTPIYHRIFQIFHIPQLWEFMSSTKNIKYSNYSKISRKNQIFQIFYILQLQEL